MFVTRFSNDLSIDYNPKQSENSTYSIEEMSLVKFTVFEIALLIIYLAFNYINIASIVSFKKL